MIEHINESVRGLNPYVPGKPIEELARERGLVDIVKLASNENPRGPSRKVLDAIGEEASSLSRYPDGSGYVLKQKLASRLGVAVEQITLGNGSNDVLELATRVAISPGCEAIVDEHCFVVYPLAVAAAHGVLVVAKSRNWCHDLDAMVALVTPATRILFIANPNNPTGTWVDESTLRALLSDLPEHVWVVVDEAYFEYVTAAEYPNGVSLVEEFPNLIVTRTFSKVYGLASLRIGYSVSSAEFADLMNRIRHPFNVNSVALAAAAAALDDEDYVRESIRLNDEGMQQIESAVQKLGVASIPSVGNFITIETGPDSMEIYERLLQRGVIVRPIANYKMPHHLRVTVGTPSENERFIRALEESL